MDKAQKNIVKIIINHRQEHSDFLKTFVCLREEAVRSDWRQNRPTSFEADSHCLVKKFFAFYTTRRFNKSDAG
jgi:hypothetical protein